MQATSTIIGNQEFMAQLADLGVGTSVSMAVAIRALARLQQTNTSFLDGKGRLLNTKEFRESLEEESRLRYRVRSREPPVGSQFANDISSLTNDETSGFVLHRKLLRRRHVRKIQIRREREREKATIEKPYPSLQRSEYQSQPLELGLMLSSEIQGSPVLVPGLSSEGCRGHVLYGQTHSIYHVMELTGLTSITPVRPAKRFRLTIS